MKKEIQLRPLDTTELSFENKEEFLKWRQQVLENYEKSKMDYQEEMKRLFGYEVVNED